MEPFQLKLFEDSYEVPVKLEMRLRVKEGGRAKSPFMTGYIVVTKAAVDKMLHMMKEGDAVGELFLTVAIWDNPDAPPSEKYPYTGKIEYSESGDRPERGLSGSQRQAVDHQSIWY
jgi:hypothetical protein